MERQVNYRVKETCATIIAEDEYIEIARREIMRVRVELERYIREDPFFQITFEPYLCPSHAPRIAKMMSHAGTIAGVGPMAAVAGAIAQCAVEAMVDTGATHAIVDNGGDIAMYLDHPVMAGIYTGDSSIDSLGLLFEELGCLIGVCTSSGRVGHSVSFGDAHAATILAKDVALADAAATALGNIVREEDEDDIRVAMNEFYVEGIDGMLVITGNNVVLRGRVPKICHASVSDDTIALRRG